MEKTHQPISPDYLNRRRRTTVLREALSDVSLEFFAARHLPALLELYKKPINPALPLEDVIELEGVLEDFKKRRPR